MTPRTRTLKVRAVRKLPLAIVAGLCMLSATPASVDAQRIASKTRGLVVAPHLLGASLVVEDSDRSNGGGGGVMAGWVFGNGLAAFAQYDFSNVDVRNQPATEGDWTISQFDVGLRYYFRRPQSTVVPYVLGAATYRDVKVENIQIVSPTATDVLDTRGPGFVGGAGVNLHVTPSVAFDFALLVGWGQLTEAEVDGQTVPNYESVSIQSSRFNLGLSWWPTG